MSQNLQEYNVYASNNIIKFLNNVHPQIKKKFYQLVNERLKVAPKKVDDHTIKNLKYDLYELKIKNNRFYYFVVEREVKIVEFYLDGEFNPLVEIFKAHTKDEQKHKLKYILDN